MRPLHVLHVIGGGDTGGAMSHLLPLLSALGRSGCDVHLLCLGEGGLADEARRRGLPVSVLPMNGARDPRVLGPLRRFLAAGSSNAHAPEAWPPAERPRARWDVVHTHGMRANLPVRLVARVLRPRPCLLTTVHSDLALDYGSATVARVYREIDRATAAAVDRIVCVSESLKGLLMERGYPVEKLVTIHSGLEAGSGPGAATAAAGGLNAAHDAETPRQPSVGTAARLVAVKDVDLLLEVASALRRTHPELQVIVVGDGPERARLESLVAGMGTDRVLFTGRLDEVGPIWRKLDVYIVTSVFEGGVSMSVLEAMDNGLPVVTTAAGGVAEAVVDGETGYVVTRDQERGALVAALAERAAALLDDPALRARMGAAGARRVREHFTIEQTAARTLRAYERCLAARDGHVRP
ncbi:MAG: glycosyltransferase family 4 protein [Thermoleophilia bacterium]|nr:glycosyltransferase family 4 protein [Thermoleophilia bacterium]